MRSKAIIFGAGGQDGRYLSCILDKMNVTPIRVTKNVSAGNQIQGDVSSRDRVNELVKEYKPQMIFHLAAHSTTSHSALFQNHEAIATGTWNILEAVRDHCKDCKVMLAGSGLQFVNKGKPIRENDPFEARDVYSVSRIQSVYAARYYRSLGLKVYVSYLFHHESPLRTERHISRRIIEALKRIKQGSSEKITIGDASVRKEWSYAGDIVEGMITLMSQERIFEAVIGSGKAYSIEEYLQTCFSISGLDHREHVNYRSDFVPEYDLLVSDPFTINSLGWRADTDLEELVRIMLGLKTEKCRIE